MEQARAGRLLAGRLIYLAAGVALALLAASWLSGPGDPPDLAGVIAKGARPTSTTKKPPEEMKNDRPSKDSTPIAGGKATSTFTEKTPPQTFDITLDQERFGDDPPHPPPNWILRSGDLACDPWCRLYEKDGVPILQFGAEARAQTPAGVVTRTIDPTELEPEWSWTAPSVVERPPQLELAVGGSTDLELEVELRGYGKGRRGLYVEGELKLDPEPWERPWAISAGLTWRFGRK